MKTDFSSASLRNAVILCVVFFGLCLAYEYITRPGNYEDCVLTHLKTDGSRFAASFIDEMCEAKFGRK